MEEGKERDGPTLPCPSFLKISGAMYPANNVAESAEFTLPATPRACFAVLEPVLRGSRRLTRRSARRRKRRELLVVHDFRETEVGKEEVRVFVL